MNFFTLHELARELDRPERVICYRFHALREMGKLTLGRDFRREDFIDKQHCVYKIDRQRFMAESKMPSPARADNDTTHAVSQFVDQVKKPVINNSVPTGDSPCAGQHQGNNAAGMGNQFVNKDDANVNDERLPADTKVLTEFLDTLKEQLRVKDSQIEGYRTELHTSSELLRGTVGELLKVQEQIRLLSSKTPEAHNGRIVNRQRKWDTNGAEISGDFR